MIRFIARRGAALLLAGACVLGAAACAEPAPLTPPGRFAENVDLTGQAFTVGGKEFDEQLILCKMTIALLQSARATVVDRCDTQGSGNTRAALTSDQIDMYWEYTGTAWRTYLGQESRLPDPRALFAAVRDADTANGVVWLDPAPFDNTFAIGVRSDLAQRLGVRTLSDLARLAVAGAPESTMCVAEEFAGREDGLQGLLRIYGFALDSGRLTTRSLDDVYPALAAASPCVFGEVFSTDGRLNTLRIATLIDDRGYFLPYNAALTVRREVLDRDPRLALFGRILSPMLTETVMRGLNERVSVGKRAPDEVARSFLREHGLIG